MATRRDRFQIYTVTRRYLSGYQTLLFSSTTDREADRHRFQQNRERLRMGGESNESVEECRRRRRLCQIRAIPRPEPLTA